jgi:hypothetical protein
VLQTQGLQARNRIFAGIWGRFGGGRVALQFPIYQLAEYHRLRRVFRSPILLGVVRRGANFF